MSKPETCTCPDALPNWRPTAPNEDGWHCQYCCAELPGEPPGYRPDLDESEIEEKVDAILTYLTLANFVYVSNSGHAEYLISAASDRCRASRCFDQISIIMIIAEALGDRKYWRDLGESIRAGKDSRERCHCGKLATSFGGGHPPQCSEHGMASLMDSLAADLPPPGTPEPPDPWQVFGEWVEEWRANHPGDDRSELDLIEEYGKVTDAGPGGKS
jgi:hypothetical protein